jgi:glycosyltransferase involved in cell wall biosynthesis
MTELSGALSKKGIDITVFCAQPVYDLNEWEGDIPNYLDYQGIAVHRARTVGKHKSGLLNRLLFALSYMFKTLIFAWKNGKKFDGILVGTNPPFLGIVPLILKKLLGKKYVLIVYDVYPEYAINLGVISEKSFVAKIWQWFTERIVNNAAANVVIGRDMKKRIIAKLDQDTPDNTILIPNWSDEGTVKPFAGKYNGFREELGIEDEFMVLYSGTMNRSHNLEPLLDAAELLEGEPYKFVFVGQGSNKKNLKNIAQGKKLRNVQFLPFQSKERLPEVLASCDISVVCLDKKHTGISVPSKTYGIMAAGKPILAFVQKEGEIGLTITESRCGFVMEDPDGEMIAAKLREANNNGELLEVMSENSYQSFKEKYTLGRSSEKYYRLIHEVF